ncbi:hypothetical protein IKF33_00210 [Candidatus Saccharibacteria bacterium]|nr:hypothetical protein [Candidatus Saccharibacteria bacterium]
MKRIILVYNPRSSKQALIKQEVLDKVWELKGYTVGKYEVRPTNVDDNASVLAKLLEDDDILITAGGDGTATIGLNGAILSKKSVQLAALPYGNFNDLAGILKVKTIEDIVGGKTGKLWPLEVKIDGKHWRYAACYVTMGLFAESTKIFDVPKIRHKLREEKGLKRLVYSVWVLKDWYFKNRKREFLPTFTLNGKKVEGMTDYLTVNGKTMAKMMRGGQYYSDAKKFGVRCENLAGFWSLVWFMMRSILAKVPVESSNGDVLEFVGENELEIQAEGEYQRLKNVKKIEIRKCENPVRVILKA